MVAVIKWAIISTIVDGKSVSTDAASQAPAPVALLQELATTAMGMVVMPLNAVHSQHGRVLQGTHGAEARHVWADFAKVRYIVIRTRRIAPTRLGFGFHLRFQERMCLCEHSNCRQRILNSPSAVFPVIPFARMLDSPK